MDLLRNYQVRKQLGLTEDEPGDINLDEILSEKLNEALRSAFPQVAVSSILNRPSARTSMIRWADGNSPRNKFRTNLFTDDSMVELRSIIDGLESRVDTLESMNQQMSQTCGSQQSELERLRLENVAIKKERDQLSSQIAGLKSVVSSESSAGKVLERVSHTDQLEFKLEIYRQQIAMLNEELEKLKRIH